MIMIKSAERKRVGPRRLLRADAATLAKLTQAGEVMFSEAETALLLGVATASVTRLLRNSPKARMAYQGARLGALEALRRAQFKHAQTNPSMAMFLGRTYLGQSEQREGEDGETFDLAGAARRLREKLAAIAAEPVSPGDREGG